MSNITGDEPEATEAGIVAETHTTPSPDEKPATTTEPSKNEAHSGAPADDAPEVKPPNEAHTGKDLEPETEDPITEHPADDPAVTHPDAVNVSKPDRPKHRLRKVLLTSLLVLVLLINGAGVYANVYLHNKVLARARAPSVSIKLPAPTTSKTVTGQTPSAPQPTTLHYVSNALHVEFDYPVDWRIGGTADDKYLSLNSAPFSVPGTNSGSVQGDLVLAIADPSQEQGQFGQLNDNDVISADSEPLTYANPTPVQRKSTNISFDSFSNSDDIQKGLARVILISGNLVYRKGQLLGSKSYKSITPHIYAYFDPCGIDGYHCTAYDSTGVSLDTWHNDPNFAKLRDLIMSLRFSQ